MGNYRSGRWNFHTARQTTGASRRIYPKNIRPAIAFAEKGSLARWSFSWNRGGEPCGSISYQVEIKNDLYFLRLIYTVALAGKEPEPLDYSILLTTTPTPWGQGSCPDGYHCVHSVRYADRYVCEALRANNP